MSVSYNFKSPNVDFDKFMADIENPKQFEKDASKKLDVLLGTQNLEKKVWATWTFYSTIAFTLMECLVLFHETDFVNLTVCMLAVYILMHSTSKKAFRLLVVGILASIVFDVVFYLLLSSSEYS